MESDATSAATLYKIIVRNATQYSLLPIEQPAPPGWESTDQRGSLAECLAYIAAQVALDGQRPKTPPAPTDAPTPPEPALRSTQGVVSGPVPLTPAQHKFFTLGPVEPHHWNLTAVLAITPAPDPHLIAQAVQQLIRHHDGLRLRLVREEAGWRQFIAEPDDQLPFALKNLAGLPKDEQLRTVETIANAFQTSLNLAEGPLLRVILFLFGDQQPAWLLLIVNHLIADGLSMQILLADLHIVYQQLGRGEPPRLPPKTTSFKQWVERQVEYAQSEQVRGELDYWRSIARTPIPKLPADGLDSPLIETYARTITTSLSEEYSRKLLRDVLIPNQIAITDVLLAALAMSVVRWRGAGAVLIDFVQNGRVTLFKDVDLSRTVGWLSISYPLCIQLHEPHTPLDALATVIRQIRRVPNRGFGYELLCYLTQKLDATELQTILRPELMLNFIGQFKSTRTDASWQPITVPVGFRGDLKNISFLRLYCEGSVVGDQLNVSWTFNTHRYHHETIAHLSSVYLECLQAIIDTRLARLR